MALNRAREQTRRTQEKVEIGHPFCAESLDFEIAFFESVLTRCPTHRDSLRVLGQAYTTKGLLTKGLEMDRRLVSLEPTDSLAHYNLACSLSLLRRLDESIQSLEQAVRLGYRDAEYLTNDSDLDNLKQDDRFWQIVSSLSAQAAPEPSAL